MYDVWNSSLEPSFPTFSVFSSSEEPLVKSHSPAVLKSRVDMIEDVLTRPSERLQSLLFTPVGLKFRFLPCTVTKPVLHDYARYFGEYKE